MQLILNSYLKYILVFRKAVHRVSSHGERFSKVKPISLYLFKSLVLSLRICWEAALVTAVVMGTLLAVFSVASKVEAVVQPPIECLDGPGEDGESEAVESAVDDGLVMDCCIGDGKVPLDVDLAIPLVELLQGVSSLSEQTILDKYF